MRRVAVAVAAAPVLLFGLVTPAIGGAAAAGSAASCTSEAPPGTGNGPRALSGIEFSDPKDGWAVGGNRVLSTVDGGRHWTPSYRHLGADFFQVDAYNGKDAWALGVGGVARTTDGGGSWTWRSTGCPSITSIDFFSPRDGIAVAGASLLRTSDGGRRWTDMTAPRKLQSACFSDARHGWAGAHGQIYRTTDGGHHWRLNEPGPRWGRTRQLTTAYVQCAGPVAGWGELDVGDAAMNQSQHVGYHLAASGSRPLFAEGYFSSGALRRLPASPSSEPVAFSAISATEAAYLDYCAPCGNDGESVVGVVTRTDHLDPSLRIRHIAAATAGAFLSATSGWVVGSTSFATSRHQRWRIEHTADGGRTWITQYQS